MKKKASLKDLVQSRNYEQITPDDLTDQQKQQLKRLEKDYDKYKDMDENALMREMQRLLKNDSVKRNIQSGKTDQIRDALLPVLNRQQKQKLDQILDWMKRQ